MACRAARCTAVEVSQVASGGSTGPCDERQGAILEASAGRCAGTLQVGVLSGGVACGGRLPGVAADVLWQEGVAGAHAGGSGVPSVSEGSW